MLILISQMIDVNDVKRGFFNHSRISFEVVNLQIQSWLIDKSDHDKISCAAELRGKREYLTTNSRPPQIPPLRLFVVRNSRSPQIPPLRLFVVKNSRPPQIPPLRLFVVNPY